MAKWNPGLRWIRWTIRAGWVPPLWTNRSVQDSPKSSVNHELQFHAPPIFPAGRSKRWQAPDEVAIHHLTSGVRLNRVPSPLFLGDGQDER